MLFPDAKPREDRLQDDRGGLGAVELGDGVQRGREIDRFKAER